MISRACPDSKGTRHALAGKRPRCCCAPRRAGAHGFRGIGSMERVMVSGRRPGTGKKEKSMAGDGDNVRRVLLLRIRALGDAGQFLALMKSATPFYQALGGRR